MKAINEPKFKEKDFLINHIQSIMDFYHPNYLMKFYLPLF